MQPHLVRRSFQVRSATCIPMMNTIRHVLLAITLALSPAASRAQNDDPLVHEGIVNAPLAKVWAAYTTKAGLESWMAAHAEIDLTIGGVMKTQFDPKGTTDDAKAIANTILSYEPGRMLSFRVTKFPQGFPFPTAIRNMWTIVYFEAQGENATRIREVCLGFGQDNASQMMREFFDRSNAGTLKLLQKQFAPNADSR